MNFRMVFHTIGQVVKIEAVLLVLPAIIALCYGEGSGEIAFAAAALIAAALGFLMTGLSRPKKKDIFSREGLVITALAWLMLSLVGALPFIFTGELGVVDAFFETVSGFTTTGGTVVRNVEELSHGALFWRALTHWIGGMGILVFMSMISSTKQDHSMSILRAEMPGPIVDKILPRAKDTARVLYIIYFALTALEAGLLMIGGMPVFDSVAHALSTAGTGGFGTKAASIGGYTPYLQWVVAIFMLLFGVNFNVYYLLLLKRFRAALSSRELYLFGGIVAVSVAAITVNIRSLYSGVGESLRYAVFHVATIISTTGFAVTDHMQWPIFSRGILLILMFLGGCAGSTAGGLKLSRVMILCKMIRREVRSVVHPRAVTAVRIEGKVVDEEKQRSVAVYFAIYMICILLIFLLLTLEPYDFETCFSAAVSCFNNVGLGLGAIGPTGGYADFSIFSKLLLSLAMLMGRLEIFPVLLAMIPSTWRRR